MGNLQKTSWEALEVDKMSDKISRQMISGENGTLARILLARGAAVARHHRNT